MRYIDFNLSFRFILIFQKYTDEVDDLLEALVGHWLRFLDCCWIQGHRKQVNLIFKVFENGRSGLIQTIWGAETFFLLRLFM